MAEIIAVRFKREGKQYYFDPQGLQVQLNEGVIVETSWGAEYGVCSRGNAQVSEDELVAPLRPVIRIATEEDLALVEENRKKEDEAFRICAQKVIEHELDMKLVDVEFSFEGSKILFFFTSEGRVDFRGLVKDLASIFHNRIELRQIGVRDESKMLGGLGICGREFCCSSFLREFQPVSIKMAKTQNLSLNPTKISGTCGRLMCCLKYEQDAYEDLLKHSPKEGSFVVTPDGVGDIITTNVLREKVSVRLDASSDSLKTYRNSEVRVIRRGKGKRPDEYELPTQQEMEAMRYVEPEEKPFIPDISEVSFLEQTDEVSTKEQINGKQKGKSERNSYRRNGHRPKRNVERRERIDNGANAKPIEKPKEKHQVEHTGKQEDSTKKKQQPRRNHKLKSKQAIQKAQPTLDETKAKEDVKVAQKNREKTNKKPYWKRRSKPNKKPNEQK